MRLSIDPSIRRRRLLATLALSTLVGLVAAALNTGSLSLFPPRVGGGELEVAAATTHAFIDTSTPSVVHRGEYPVSSLIKRAELLGRVMISPPVLERIGKRTGIDPRDIGTGARSSADVPLALTEPGSEQRASDIERSGKPFHIEVQARPDTPVLDVYTEAPSAAQATRLADAAIAGLDDELAALADSQSIETDARVRAPPARTRAGRRRQRRHVDGDRRGHLPGRRGARVPRALAARPAAPRRAADPAPAAGRRRRRRGRLAAHHAAAAVDLRRVPRRAVARAVQRDRAHDPAADRPQVRPAHPPVRGRDLGARAAARRAAARRGSGSRGSTRPSARSCCARSSASSSTRAELNQTLELEGSLKQLPLLLAYVSLFVIASSARPPRRDPRLPDLHARPRRDLRARHPVGVPLQAEPLLRRGRTSCCPGIFDVGPARRRRRSTTSAGGWSAGRRRVPLEAVAMLAMALPIALVLACTQRRLARAAALRPRRVPAARRGVRDLPQERAARAGLACRHDRLLPPPRAAQARAARRSCSW